MNGSRAIHQQEPEKAACDSGVKTRAPRFMEKTEREQTRRNAIFMFIFVTFERG